ncbi:glutamine--fructose-6-phosphate transaminase (isomerizing) [Haloarcula onubensis]|uniref:glutamine--fructose-6-phosphate transaminase (isomerizing) n=1 Tax=Haloarcula onubensis TaxID=2950539 RepID=A0ABU2FPG3_9EURY|nr:glutamine--fructose-6-phosphate transaminase (isomerizing) [Halomicroarcula sp. S3CR25-11]MDS0282639.1 glutamine--fructose-6-phosphate transaminase (isomerizing) [Halomicroarcula sp. S3CR25-11]
MCGIIARASPDDAVGALVDGLERLEYRGYDSAGVAVQHDAGIAVHKHAGEVADVRDEIQAAAPAGSVGIGHTRWSTHGPPTDANAHPHTSDGGTVAVVHNGIIENHAELRGFLSERGYEFTSDTDTEVVPHLVEHFLGQADETLTAFRRAVDRLEGSYAIAAVVEGEDRVYATRAGSPLVLGVDDDACYLASDIPAFIEHTRDIVYLEDGDVVVAEPDGAQVFDADASPVERRRERVDWNSEEVGKGTFDHFMLKEIHSQPASLGKTTRGRIADDKRGVRLEELDTGVLDGVADVHFVACGTSYHAALIGARMLSDVGVRTRVFRASEYAKTAGPVSETTLVVPVTQSGETADTLSALRTANERGAATMTVTNVVGSTAAREADESLFIRAGPEIGVAATKTFTSQVVTLTLLAQQLAADLPGATPRDDLPELLTALERIPEHVEQVVTSSRASDLATRLLEYDAYFFIGRGMSQSVALEGALKFKEITYEHAEGFAAGQLKHGPLALVTPETPVVGVFTGEEAGQTVTNAMEARTRGAEIIGVGPAGGPGEAASDIYLTVPDTHPVCQNLLANVQLQLFAYHTAKELDRSIDKPRNLAKSVTVQ